MAKHYVNGDTGSDLNTGLLLGAPKFTVGSTLSSYTLAAGDSVEMGEKLVESVAASNQTGVTYQQEPTYSPYKFQGLIDPTLAGGVWGLHGGATWKVAIEAGITMGASVDRWSSRVFNTYQHGGFMSPMAVPAAASNIPTGGTITANTIANPTVVTCVAHGLVTGSKITISGSNSTPVINGTYLVTRLSANTFSVPVNVTGLGTAGTWVVASLGLYAYDDILGIWYVRLNDNSDPRTNQGTADAVMFTNGNWAAGLQLIGATNCTISDGTFFGYLGTIGLQPVYGLAPEGNGLVVSGIATFQAGEVHTITMTGTLGNGQVRNCTFNGMGRTNASSHVVFYNSLGHINGARSSGNTYHCYGLLDWNGVPLNANDYLSSDYAHTNNDAGDMTGNRVVDIERTDETSWFYGQQGSSGDAGNTAAIGADKYNVAHYPARNKRKHHRNGSGNLSSGNIAYQRNLYDFTQAKNFSSALLWAFSGGVTTAAIRAGSCLLESCHVIADLNDATPLNRRSLFYIPTGNRLTLINVNVIIFTANAVATYHNIFAVQDGSTAAFNLGSAGFEVNAYGCNFIFVTADGGSTQENNLFSGDNAAAPDGNFNFVSNNYWHINGDGGRATDLGFSAGNKTLADWLANRDPTGINVDPGFVNALDTNPLTAGRLLGTSALYSNRKSLAHYGSVGINGASRGPTGLIGAWNPASTPAAMSILRGQRRILLPDDDFIS